MRKYFIMYFTILSFATTLFTASGCFYRAVNNDMYNCAINGVLCLVDISIFTYFLMTLIKEFNEYK